MTGILVGFTFVLLMVTGASIGFAWLFDVIARGLSVTLKAVIAATLSGTFPFILSAFTVVAVAPTESLVEALIPAFLGALVSALLFGFPAAYFFLRRRARRRKKPVNPSTFE